MKPKRDRDFYWFILQTSKKGDGIWYIGPNKKVYQTREDADDALSKFIKSYPSSKFKLTVMYLAIEDKFERFYGEEYLKELKKIENDEQLEVNNNNKEKLSSANSSSSINSLGYRFCDEISKRVIRMAQKFKFFMSIGSKR